MALAISELAQKLADYAESNHFSGVVSIHQDQFELYGQSFGLANRSDEIPNTMDTRFGIASGCKLFTAVAIAQLVERGVISFDSLLSQCLDISFPKFDPSVTVRQLLTHCSGIPDYFDEDVMDNFEELWITTPMYRMREPKDFLPLFQNHAMKSKPGAAFSYNNAGFILLGLIIEQQTKMSFTQYVEQFIFAPSDMTESGYFLTDRLPARTAYGYLDDHPDGTWRTNIFALPIVGGPDGGAYTTASDMRKFWRALKSYELLSPELTHLLLAPQVEHAKDRFYGLGIWMETAKESVRKYYVMGSDPGVGMYFCAYPKHGLEVVILANINGGAGAIQRTIDTAIRELEL